MVSTDFSISGLALLISATVRSSNGRASLMLDSVLLSDFSSSAIFETVSLAAATCHPSAPRPGRSTVALSRDSTYSLALKALDNLVPLGHIVVNRLEAAEDLLGVLQRRLVLQDRLVVLQIHLGHRRLQGGIAVRGRRVTRAERLQLRDGLLAEAQRAVDLAPVLYAESDTDLILHDMRIAHSANWSARLTTDADALRAAILGRVSSGLAKGQRSICQLLMQMETHDYEEGKARVSTRQL